MLQTTEYFKEGALHIPNAFNGKILASVFEGNADIICVETYAKEICENAFKNCMNLESIILRNISKIADNAFENCDKLVVINIFNTLDFIRENEAKFPRNAKIFYSVGNELMPYNQGSDEEVAVIPKELVAMSPGLRDRMTRGLKNIGMVCPYISAVQSIYSMTDTREKIKALNNNDLRKDTDDFKKCLALKHLFEVIEGNEVDDSTLREYYENIGYHNQDGGVAEDILTDLMKKIQEIISPDNLNIEKHVEYVENLEADTLKTAIGSINPGSIKILVITPINSELLIKERLDGVFEDFVLTSVLLHTTTEHNNNHYATCRKDGGGWKRFDDDHAPEDCSFEEVQAFCQSSLCSFGVSPILTYENERA